MCVGDYRLGRLIRSQASRISVPAAAGSIVPANLDRVGLAFSTSPAGDLSVWPASDVAVGVAFVSNVTMPNLFFTLIEHGDIVTKEWFGLHAAGPLTFGIIEFWLPEAALAAEGITWPPG